MLLKCYPYPYPCTGEGIGCFVILKEGVECDGNHAEELRNKLKLAVRVAIGPIATPDFIVFGDLPKTR
ncbi:hypothetical protein EON63_16155 [archaeon]|nr:MAG: hypothetical protein EON63_16155 [archaeon]